MSGRSLDHPSATMGWELKRPRPHFKMLCDKDPLRRQFASGRLGSRAPVEAGKKKKDHSSP